MDTKKKDNIKALNELWQSYVKQRDLNSKHKLILHYIWLVKYVLQYMHLPVNTLMSDEDFINIGIIGLNDAIDRYDLARGVKFESFALPRIKGTIQDELRKLDWLSRTARKKATDLLDATDKLRSETGREVSSEEIIQKLNITPEQYHTYLEAAAAAKASLSMNESSFIGLNDEDEEVNFLEEIPDESYEDTLTTLESKERLDFLTNYLSELKERKRLVMTLYYYENLTFKEIGNVLNVSESRICQIHTQVVDDLRAKLYEYDNA
jgi:RNA polymerase sigma factor for flagellar operon FliA